MRIEPPKREPSGKVVALVVVDEDGEPYAYDEAGTYRKLAETPSNVVLYAQGRKDLYALVRSGRGRVRRWKHTIVSFDIDGRKIRITRGALARLSLDDALSELTRYADWVRAFRGNPGTFAGSANSILRGTLERPVMIREPDIDYGTYPLGARVESAVPRGRYEFISSWDIHGAYPDAMSHLRFPRQYFQTPRASLQDKGFAFAEVHVPDGSPWNPLPLKERGRLLFPSGDFEGFWPISELQMAEHSGARVRIIRAYVARGSVSLFSDEWNRAVTVGRNLGGAAGQLAKGTINSLWGSLAISGRGEYWSWPNGEFHRETDERMVFPRSPATAARIVSHVRQRLYREALCENVFILGCHTDGLLVEAGCTFTPNGGDLGTWRVKSAGIAVDFISPQVWRMLTGNGWKYTVAGVSDPERAEAAFKRIVREDETLRKRERRSDIMRRRRIAADRWREPVGLS
jgi:hypothetical protein